MRERRGHGSLTDAAIYICRDGYVLKKTCWKNALKHCLLRQLYVRSRHNKLMWSMEEIQILSDSKITGVTIPGGESGRSRVKQTVWINL